MTVRLWIAAYAAAVALPPPGDDEFEAILALAGAAAHGSERTAAPVACWIAARSGMSAAEALALARTVGAPPTAERRRSAHPDRSSVHFLDLAAWAGQLDDPGRDFREHELS